ncbi:hypothetical protein [Streptomyces violarus]|uniref:hypothetical protein n=1 Tax=Streptomyces violarus TaxID=67380 RepID=UPI0021BFE95D|nr:hypothetical protein [Streptomyces violarus]MCT9142416.1 hypothetical protein [Streptomyces violarus]
MTTREMKEVNLMAHWAIKVPTVTPGEDRSRSGVQWFTYPAAAFPHRGDVVKQVRKDVDTDTAVRHRGGALADVSAIRVVWHDDVLSY